MVKNKGGNKTKGKARKHNRPRTLNIDDLKKINGQEYAHVTEKYGDGRYNLICYDKVTRLGIMRGKLKRYARLDRGGFVLVSLRDFEDNKCDIVEVYKEDDIEKLISAREVSSSFVKEGKLIESSKDNDNLIDFGGASNNLDERDEEDEVQVNNGNTDWLEGDDDNTVGFGNNNKYDDIGINIDDI